MMRSPRGATLSAACCAALVAGISWPLATAAGPALAQPSSNVGVTMTTTVPSVPSLPLDIASQQTAKIPAPNVVSSAGPANGQEDLVFTSPKTGYLAAVPEPQTSGYAVGATSELERTTNGGASWHELPVRISLPPVSAPAAQAGGAAWYWATSTLYFVNQQVGFAYPDAMYGEEAPWPGALFRTTDGGKRWAPVAFRGGTPSGRLAFVDATHGFATGLSASAAGGLQRRGAARAVPEGRTRVPADCANGRRKSPRSDRWSGSPAMHRKV